MSTEKKEQAKITEPGNAEPAKAAPKRAASSKSKQEETDWKKKFQELEAKVNAMMGQKKPQAPQAPHIKRSEKFDKDKETAMVKGKFLFHEQRGKVLKWYDRFPWPGSKMTKYEAKDQTVVELPYYVARRLMAKGVRPVYSEIKNAEGKVVQEVTDYVRRFDFIPMNTFIHVDTKPKLSTVQSM